MLVTITRSWLVAMRCTRNAREANPRRWARQTRNWTQVAAVTLNPERESVVNAALQSKSNRQTPHRTSGNYLDTRRDGQGTQRILGPSGGQGAFQ